MNDPRRRLDDIRARCEDGSDLVGRGRNAFESDRLLRHAAKSILADIGEAAKNLEDLSDRIPTVPWKLLARMRDRMSHRYFDVDYEVVWDTLAVDLPLLRRAIEDFLDGEGS